MVLHSTDVGRILWRGQFLRDGAEAVSALETRPS